MAIRYDAGRISGKVTRTPQGGLRVPAAVSRTGILEYRNPDGTVRREFRPREEVFHEDSLASLAGAPVTQFHPGGMVSPENFGKVAVGYMGDSARQDGDVVLGTMAIQDGLAVKRVQAKELIELSAGYTCTIDATPGEYLGQRYDAVQREIRYNHVALLPPGAGRSGPEVALRLDAAGDCIAPEDWGRKEETMKIEIINGTEYEVGTDAHRKASAERKDAADTLARATAERDAAVAKVKDLEARIDGEEARVAATVSARLALHKSAIKAGVEVRDDAKEDDVRRAVIAKILPSVQIEGKTGAYLEALFDVAMGQIEQVSLDGARKDAKDAAEGGNGGPVERKDEAARQKMIENSRGAWRADGPGRAKAPVEK
jgi:hypothetical protein